MKTLQEATLIRARAYARSRGWRVDPLTWEEVEVLVDLASENITTDYEVGYEVGYSEGFDAGRVAEQGRPLTHGRIESWAGENGYTLIRDVAS